MKHILVLFGALLCAPVALADDADIWRYQNGDGVSLADTCNDRTSCTLLYQNSHYLALINHRSSTGCQLGDLLIAEHKSRSYKQFNTGTCSLSASIEVGSENRMNTVDVVNGERLIKRYPLDVWMWVEKHKEGTTVNWKKAEENAKTHPKVIPRGWLGNGNGAEVIQNDYTMRVSCAYKESYQPQKTPSAFAIYYGMNEVEGITHLTVDGTRLELAVSNQAQWDAFLTHLYAASTVSAYKGEQLVTTFNTIARNQTPCEFYQAQ